MDLPAFLVLRWQAGAPILGESVFDCALTRNVKPALKLTCSSFWERGEKTLVTLSAAYELDPGAKSKGTS